MLRSFEKKEEATTRKKNEKDCSGILGNYSFHEVKLVHEVQNAINNEISINWSETARICANF